MSILLICRHIWQQYDMQSILTHIRLNSASSLIEITIFNCKVKLSHVTQLQLGPGTLFIPFIS